MNMKNEKLTAGDIVYHKANNLRMVVITVQETAIRCRYVDKFGKFQLDNFLPIELSKTTIGDTNFPAIHQLESKEATIIKQK